MKLYICEHCGKLTNENGQRVNWWCADLTFLSSRQCAKGECIKNFHQTVLPNEASREKRYKRKYVYGRGNGQKDVKRLDKENKRVIIKAR